MSDVFTIFNEIIDNDFKLNTYPLIIEEKKNKENDKSKGRYVTLKKTTGKIFAFSLDKDGKIFVDFIVSFFSFYAVSLKLRKFCHRSLAYKLGIYFYTK